MAQTTTLESGISSITPVDADRTIEQSVARELRESILDGRLKPGVRLRYRDLASQFNVSVTPVQVALRELLTEGLVEMRPHGGASVTELSLEELEELFLMRIGLESRMAYFGAANIADDEVGSMTSFFPNLEKAATARDRSAYLNASFEYRSICYRAALRPRLLATASELFRRSARYNFLVLEENSRFDRSLEDNRAFRECCETRDGDKAQRVVRETLELSMNYFSSGLREALGNVSEPVSVKEI